MIRIHHLLDAVAQNNPNADLDIIDRAYVYSARVHSGQMRLSGEPYLSHPLEVAGILTELKLDSASIAAGLLHDVIEDTYAGAEEIEDMFGPRILKIVLGVTKISKLPFNGKETQHAENIRKMILAMADDLRVILIKLADRLHNMRTLKFHKSAKKRRAIAQETLDIYAPIAARLGIYKIKKELENIAFRYLQPDDYAAIKESVDREQEEREKYIEDVKEEINAAMISSGIKCEVFGRYKHYFSIYCKMQEQELAYQDVYDVIAFRIILDTKAHCYEVLGIIHNLWKPIDIKFKDYIARPKPNGYQSLHTTVIGPHGDRVEVQIRTHEMDTVAKSGVAAHWGYKEGQTVDENMSSKFAWIRGLVENQANFQDPDEFLENLRIDLFPDEVCLFTPRGEVKTLPKGATPVDFAYLIHTDVGNQCTGAKVNGRIAPLQYQIKTGDIVDIITTKNHKPSKDWLNFVKTVKARGRIRQWIRAEDKERSVNLGREMCEKEFRKHGLNFSQLLKSDQMTQFVEQSAFQTAEDLIANVGYGKYTPRKLVHQFIDKPEPDEEHKSVLKKLITRVKKKKAKASIIVKGIDDMLIRFGKCCEPLPGDAITGYITRGFGVTVHRKTCVNALKMNSERRIEVEWNQETVQPETYPVKIRVLSKDRAGLLRDTAASISKSESDILHVHSDTYAHNKTVDSHFTISVNNINHLQKIITSLNHVKGIKSVRRIDR
ncbi:bifunctional (p)ppGpp synthetase/guanosine-3',5'-bis(diphosphate) 3'-pyrophosphohydrolase [Desulfococcaceae bacterium HSG9]|nr:bifunctional (p)ppGpp synthetase/guanosine-3',5'-bis(diphosphate) 3'-pyrophosphohydrolase [Desulfococcaceae bacterium HSG9]